MTGHAVPGCRCRPPRPPPPPRPPGTRWSGRGGSPAAWPRPRDTSPPPAPPRARPEQWLSPSVWRHDAHLPGAEEAGGHVVGGVAQAQVSAGHHGLPHAPPAVQYSTAQHSTLQYSTPYPSPHTVPQPPPPSCTSSRPSSATRPPASRTDTQSKHRGGNIFVI